MHFIRLSLYFFLFGFFGSLATGVIAQDNLYVEKPPFKRILVEPGDSIRILQKGMDKMVGFTYQGAKDSTLYLSGDSLHLSLIEKLWIRRSKTAIHWLGSVVGGGLTAALVFPPLMLVDALGRGGLENRDWRRMGISVAGGLSIAAIFYRWRWKRYRFGDKWQLAIRVPVEKTVGGGSPSGGKQDWEGQAPLQSK